MNINRQQAQIDSICDEPQDLQNKSVSTKKFRGKESIFKRPEAPKPKRLHPNNRPDFLKNPHKWTKYSLENISSTDMSESSNASAAFTFLKELEDRRDQNNMKNISRDVGPKYNSSVKVKLDTMDNDSDTKSFKNMKVVMPEYVVGQSIKKKTVLQKQTHTKSNKKELKLSHLMDEDECDED
ncbi:protein TSSC4-like [Ctenocephalides felis]|uniref:protein TSSC4-like n=1 Tax=Ctenocephalides felis TaxID=7515 RepID=UPI000E6E1B6C|nr:protein TSSC4-like [Ctenocephalides felis]